MAHPVGQKKPNGLGIHDICGNVWEWVFDNYDWQYMKAALRIIPMGIVNYGIEFEEYSY
jgi:formylglycine-generating enzyme required for sulfatase activity